MVVGQLDCLCVLPFSQQIIDEADRMMEEIKQDWLTQVEDAVFMQSDSAQNQLQSTRSYRPLPGPNTAVK